MRFSEAGFTLATASTTEVSMEMLLALECVESVEASALRLF
jgi:hypothetical protein